MIKKEISPKGRTWEEARKELFTAEEIAASNLRISIMIELANAGKARGMLHGQFDTVLKKDA